MPLEKPCHSREREAGSLPDVLVSLIFQGELGSLPGCTVLGMPDSNAMPEQIDWRPKQPSHGRSEVLRSSRHNPAGHKAKDITPSIAWM